MSELKQKVTDSIVLLQKESANQPVREAMENFITATLAYIEELESTQSRIDTAQTCIMYDVDGGLLSHDRASIHDREVDVALVELDR